MSDVWIVVCVVGLATVAFKGVGPVLLGGRRLPAQLGGVVELLAPGAERLGDDEGGEQGGRELVADARLAGLGVAAAAIALRAPLLLVVVLAAAATALARTL